MDHLEAHYFELRDGLYLSVLEDSDSLKETYGNIVDSLVKLILCPAVFASFVYYFHTFFRLQRW